MDLQGGSRALFLTDDGARIQTTADGLRFRLRHRLRCGAQRGAVLRRHLAAGKSSRDRGRGFGKNPDANLPGIVAVRSRAIGARYLAAHLHEQGGAGNGRAGALAGARRCIGSLGGHFPLNLQPHPPPPRGRDRFHKILLHPRPRRSEIPDERGCRRLRYRYETTPLPQARCAHLHVQPDGEHKHHARKTAPREVSVFPRLGRGVGKGTRRLREEETRYELA